MWYLRIEETLPLSTLFSSSPANTKLGLHNSSNIGPLALSSFFSQKSQNFILFLCPNFSFWHYNINMWCFNKYYFSLLAADSNLTPLHNGLRFTSYTYFWDPKWKSLYLRIDYNKNHHCLSIYSSQTLFKIQYKDYSFPYFFISIIYYLLRDSTVEAESLCCLLDLFPLLYLFSSWFSSSIIFWTC